MNARSLCSLRYMFFIRLYYIIIFCLYVYIIWRPNRLIIVAQAKLIQLQAKEIYRLFRFHPSQWIINQKIFITPNRYSVLTTLNDSNDNTQPNKTQSRDQKITPKPPAVYVKGVSNFSSFASNLMTIINTTEFICKTTTSYLIIHTHFYEHYRLLIKYLIETNISFHSYHSYDKRPLRVVIRNFDPSTTTDDIITALSELGHQVTRSTTFITLSALPINHLCLSFSSTSKKPLTIYRFIQNRVSSTHKNYCRKTLST
jgi:hypothetical protein